MHRLRARALPISGLDGISLQKRLGNIGKMPRDPSAEGATKSVFKEIEVDF